MHGGIVLCTSDIGSGFCCSCRICFAVTMMSVVLMVLPVAMYLSSRADTLKWEKQ